MPDATASGDARRLIPRTDAVLADPPFAEAVRRVGSRLVKQAISVAQGQARRGEIKPEQVTETAAALLPRHATTMRPVINATGTILHTNLGRASLSAAACDAVVAASGCTDVEFDLTRGARAARGRGALEALLSACPAAEAVHVVNNNAAALVLTATALAQGREIIIGRGEMVAIGDGFRIPELLASTGARLREVGTTNQTTAADYISAIGEETGFILKVHPSNFQVTGFVRQPSIRELSAARGARSVPIVFDIGSGLLTPDALLPDEPDAASSLSAGADLVTASGDKLLGGPQAGLLLGRAGLITTLRRHPLARALRVDKLTFAALEATLTGPATPTARMLTAAAETLDTRAHEIAARLSGHDIDARVITTSAVVGGGGAPGVTLPSTAVSLPEGFAAGLRTGAQAVVGRVEDGRLLLDLRTVDPAEDSALVAAVLSVMPSFRCP
jgi:L-seryl-tRNA(Ser) seleniumtransferase